jgi:molybdopterin converting factor small subunit
MQITVRLLAGYRRYLPEGHDDQAGYRLEVPPGTKVGEVLAGAPIPQGEVYTFLASGRHASRDQVLEDGDVLAVFPAVGGGQ